MMRTRPGCPNHLVIKKETMTMKGESGDCESESVGGCMGIKPSIVSEKFSEKIMMYTARLG